MIAEWSAVIAAAVFVIGTAGLLIAVRAALMKLSRIESAALELQQEMKAALKQGNSLMESAEQSVHRANEGLESISRLLEAIGRIGGAIGHTAFTVERITAAMAASAEQQANRSASKQQASDMMEWTELAMTAWTLWQSRRKRGSGDPSDE